MRKLFLILFICIFAVAAAGQSAPESSNKTSESGIRVFVSDRDSWEATATGIANKDFAASTMQAGVRRVNPEQIKTLNKECPQVTITSSPAKADFFIVWDTKTWQQTSWSGHQNEYNVYNRDADLVGSGAAHKIPNAAKEICKIVIEKNQAAVKKNETGHPATN